MALDDFWEFFKTNGLGEAGDEITSEERFIDLERALWFIMGRLMYKEHCNMFNGNMYYTMGDIKKIFNMEILEYSERVRGMFEMEKLLPPPIMKNDEYHEAVWDSREMK